MKRLNRSKGGTIALFIFIAVAACFSAFPMVLVIGNSLKNLTELWRFPPTVFPKNPTIKNFIDMVNAMSGSVVPFSRYLLNTVLITVFGTLANVIAGSMAAYALCKLQFPGRKFIFNLIVKALMFNTTVTAIPLFVIMSNMGIVDSIWSIILPTLGSTLSLYLIKQFMEQSIPDSLLEAARLDGASEWKVFWKIVMPNIKPAWCTAILLSVQAYWNTSPNMLIYSEEKKTLAYVLGQISATGLSRAGVTAAITVFMIIVPVTVFIVSQSQVLQTMATSGMKE